MHIISICSDPATWWTACGLLKQKADIIQVMPIYPAFSRRQPLSKSKDFENRLRRSIRLFYLTYLNSKKQTYNKDAVDFSNVLSTIIKKENIRIQLECTSMMTIILPYY